MMKVRNRILALFLVALMALSFAAPAYAADQDLTGQIVILHTNDGHGRAAEGTYGISGVSALKKDFEARGASVLVLDAGDTLHGLPFATLDQGESVAKMMEMAGYAAMCPGNHDFNYGADYLMELAKTSGFKILSANLTDKTTGQPAFEQYTIAEAGTKKLGIFGLTTPQTAVQTNPKNVERITFEGPIAAAEKMVKTLKAENVDYIIALGHIGVDESSPVTSDEIIEAVDGIDVFIDGHSHTEFPEGERVKNTLLVSAGEYYDNVGSVTIAGDGTVSARLIVKDGDEEAARDPEIDQLAAEIGEERAPLLNEVVASVAVNLDGERETNRSRETNLGNLAADAIRWATGADIAVTNGGGIRSSIPAGEVTKGQIINVFPFGNYVVTKNVTGQEIKEALEYSVKDAPALLGGFLQVSGVSFTYDQNKAVGGKVSDIQAGGEPLDLEKTYLLATNDFLAAGGDGYEMLKDCPEVNQFNALEEILISYLAEHPDAAPQVEGRIRAIPLAAAEPAPEEEAETEESAMTSYTVANGDVLWRIAEKVLGDKDAWREIYELNKDILSSPDLIYPGQTLRIAA